MNTNWHISKFHLMEFEKALVQVAIDLKEIFVLDGIDLLADPPAVCI